MIEKDKIKFIRTELSPERDFYGKIPYLTKNERQGLGLWYKEEGLLEDLIPYSKNEAQGIWISFKYRDLRDLIDLKFLSDERFT